MSELTKSEVLEINKKLLGYNLEILPLCTGSLNLERNILTHKLNSFELLLDSVFNNENEKQNNENYLDQLVFKLIPRITLKDHMGDDELMNEVSAIFNTIKGIESKYVDIKDEKLAVEVEPHRKKLPDLYKKLEKPIWVLISGNYGEVVDDFFQKIEPLKNKESKKLKM